MAKQGLCLACGAVGCSEADFICAQCGDPKKTMVVCRGCKNRIDLTIAGSAKIKEFFAAIDPSINWAMVANKNVSCGTTIVTPVCSLCRGRKELPVGMTLIYKVRGRR